MNDIIKAKIKKLVRGASFGSPSKLKELFDFIESLIKDVDQATADTKQELIADREKKIADIEATKVQLQTEIAILKN